MSTLLMTSKRSTIKAVSFDVTGTLIRYTGVLSYYFGRGYREATGREPPSTRDIDLGFKYAYAAVKHRFPNFGASNRISTPDWWRMVVNDCFVRAAAAKGEKCTREELEIAFQHVYHTFSTTEPYDVYNDTILGLKFLKSAGVKVAIISNTDERYEQILTELGVWKYIDVPILSKVVCMEKPEPRIYELMLKRAGIKADEAVHIGDSLQNDLLGPRNIGMKSLRCQRHGIPLRSHGWPSTVPREADLVLNAHDIIQWIENNC